VGVATVVALLSPLHRVLVLLQLALRQAAEGVGGQRASQLLILHDEGLVEGREILNRHQYTHIVSLLLLLLLLLGKSWLEDGWHVPHKLF